jgi:LemA protein
MQSGAPDLSAAARADATLSGLLSEVFVMAEGVPTLRTSTDFLALQRELVTTEDRLAAARRYYNFKVRDLNILVGSAISGFIARQHRIETAEYFGDAVPEAAPV